MLGHDAMLIQISGIQLQLRTGARLQSYLKVGVFTSGSTLWMSEVNANVPKGSGARTEEEGMFSFLSKLGLVTPEAEAIVKPELTQARGQKPTKLTEEQKSATKKPKQHKTFPCTCRAVFRHRNRMGLTVILSDSPDPEAAFGTGPCFNCTHCWRQD